MSGGETEAEQEIDMKQKKDKSVMEEMEALADLQAYTGSQVSSSDGKVNPEQFFIQVSNISSAIGVHRNRSENYILQLEEKVHILETRLRKQDRTSLS